MEFTLGEMSDKDWAALIKRELGAILACSENVNSRVFDWVTVRDAPLFYPTKG